MTSDQARTARALLGWEPTKLARTSGVPLASILVLERIGVADPAEIASIQTTLELAGAEFTDDGVHRRPHATTSEVSAPFVAEFARLRAAVLADPVDWNDIRPV